MRKGGLAEGPRYFRLRRRLFGILHQTCLHLPKPVCAAHRPFIRTHLPGLTWGSLLQRVLRGCRARVGGLATLKRVGRHDVPGQRGKVTLSPGVDLGAWLPLFSLPRTPAQRCEHQGANKMVPLGYLFMVDCLSCPSWDGAPCPPRSLRPAAEAHGGGFQAHV